MNLLPLIVRGLEVAAGDVVFLSNNNWRDIRFANVEDAEGDRLLISYPVQRLRHREPSQWVEAAGVLLSAEMQTVPIGNDRVAGEVLISRIGPDRAELFLVETSLPPGAQMVSVRRAHRGDGNRWVPVGDEEEHKVDDLFPPVLWSAIMRWAYSQPVDPLFDVLADEVGERRTIDAPALLKIGELDIPVQAHVTVEDHSVSAAISVHYTIANLLGNIQYEGAQWLSPVDETQSWRARVIVSGVSHGFGPEGFRASVTVLPAGFTLQREIAGVVATREVYIGAPIRAWSHPVFAREPALPALGPKYVHVPSSIQLDLFGRRAVIYDPPAHAEIDSGYTAIVHLGEPLTQHQHAIIVVLIGYLTGGRARNVVSETYAVNRKLSTDIHDRGEATQRRIPPIPIDVATPYARIITDEIPKLVVAFDRWRQTDQRSFEATFHHYAEGVDSSYPVTRILRLAVALEAFINLVTQDAAVDESILETRGFGPLRERLESSLHEYADANRERVTLEVEERYRTKLTNLNIGSNTSRIRRFWYLVPIIKDADDDDLMRRLRNASVHMGFVGDDDTPEAILRNAADADRLTDLFNRAVLTYADYHGPVRSARDGSWMEPLSGAKFRVPRLPEGDRIEIRYDAQVPPMSEVEQAISQRLRDIQRPPRLTPYIVYDEPPAV